jgi:16S rRNA (uracil1498-N3)-methyltransferase
MAKTTPRLFLNASLDAGAEIKLEPDQSHYLLNVMRMQQGDPVTIFNADAGEWLAYIRDATRKAVTIRCERRVKDASPPPDVDFLFAPLKHARLDYMVQKATELGVRRLQPVITARTIAERVNQERMRANAIEAAEQCNLVFVPEVLPPAKLTSVVASWDTSRALIYCDETAKVSDPTQLLRTLKLPAAVLVGPEGGFTSDEQQMLRAMPKVVPISLGPRIMRADTAAIAALTIVQATLGDWGHQP